MIPFSCNSLSAPLRKKKMEKKKKWKEEKKEQLKHLPDIQSLWTEDSERKWRKEKFHWILSWVWHITWLCRGRLCKGPPDFLAEKMFFFFRNLWPGASLFSILYFFFNPDECEIVSASLNLINFYCWSQALKRKRVALACWMIGVYKLAIYENFDWLNIAEVFYRAIKWIEGMSGRSFHSHNSQG